MSDIELALKLRDTFQQAADAYNEYVEKKAPPEIKKLVWSVDKIAWQESTGSKGPYLRANPQSNTDFKNMLKDVKNHGGKLNRDGFFFWVFSDAATVGRKKR